MWLQPLVIIAIIIAFGCFDAYVISHRRNREEAEREQEEQRKQEKYKKAQAIREAERIKKEKEYHEAILQASHKYDNKKFVKTIADIILTDFKYKADIGSHPAECWIHRGAISMLAHGTKNFSELGYDRLENDFELEAFTLAVLRLLPASFSYRMWHPGDGDNNYCVIHYNIDSNSNQQLKKILDD